MRDASEQKCSYKLPLNPAGVINSGERSGHWIRLRTTGILQILRWKENINNERFDKYKP
jgi:hypothetical protein